MNVNWRNFLGKMDTTLPKSKDVTGKTIFDFIRGLEKEGVSYNGTATAPLS